MENRKRSESLSDFTIPHLLHNNIVDLYKNRPKCKKSPESFPNFDKIKFTHSSEELNSFTKTTSSNINIVLNTAAITEYMLETLLISPLGKPSDKDENVSGVALNILKDEMIRISSLNKYFDFYFKIYKNKIRDLITDEEMMSINILFDIRHVIIHASALRAKWVCDEENRHYIYVDDPFYLNILSSVKKIMKINPDYYCLPETIISWNNLIDLLVINISNAFEKIINNSKNIFPNVSYSILSLRYKDFEKYF